MAAREALKDSARNHGGDESKFRTDLVNIAMTTLSSKLLTQHKEHFANLAVDAILRLKSSGDLQVSFVNNMFRYVSFVHRKIAIFLLFSSTV